MFLPKRDFANIQTKVVTGVVFTTPENCGEIFMLNTGATAGRFKGNVAGSDWVSIPAGTAFAFGYIGLPRRQFEIDPLASTIEVSMSI